jgi:hypothetical protein
MHDPIKPETAVRTTQDDEDDSGLVIRRPRPVGFCIYGKDAAADTDMKLMQVVPHNIVDQHSAVIGIPLSHVLSSKVTMSASFSPNGVATKLEFASTSFFKEIAGTLAGVPSSVTEGLDDAKALTDAVFALGQSGTSRQIQDLETRKKLLDAEIAFGGASAGRALREELERVQAELSLAKAKKDLASLAS